MKKICDFHMHSLFSDGELIPSEIARRTYILNNRAIAITDHADLSNIESIIKKLVLASEFVSKYYSPSDFILIPGIELTHVPPKSIPVLAREAKNRGAKIVVVHGETPVEPVQPGTNMAACMCPDVDILAHPGMISEDAISSAKDNGIFLELSYRCGHCLGNGRVAKLASAIGAKLLVNSDAHNIGDHLSPETALTVARGAGLNESEAETVLFKNPEILLKKIDL
ncbi:MAG: histidinol phosphate phosphatase domain-containing protein [Candidatus Methanomethyliaceae archaeon]|nr:histidinol phosphate phosphatase domain-containing protein [Candidatus Methanomethyliaceae archaeon]